MSLEQAIIIQNKLFAEFMEGRMMLNSVLFKRPPSTHTGKKAFHYEQLEYHKSWEWLMPVVEKIESIQLPSPSILACRVDISRGSCQVFKGEWNEGPDSTFISITLQGSGAKFGSVYSACVEFVKWYKIYRMQNQADKPSVEN